MANLNYDHDKIIECLRRTVPRGANEEIIKAFFNSQKPAAIVNLRIPMEERTRSKLTSKASSLRAAVKKICPGDITVVQSGKEILLIRTDQLKNLEV